MQIEEFPKFHCMLPMLQQLHKIEHYRPVTVSIVIILTANMLEKKMQRLWIEMEEKNRENVQLKNKSTNQRFFTSAPIVDLSFVNGIFSYFIYYNFDDFTLT